MTGTLDPKTGLIWLPEESGTYTYDEAVEKFNTPEKRLPTIGELRTAWENGIKFKNKWYWSSSLRAGHSDLGYDFHGGDGDFGHIANYSGGLVRCIAVR